MDLPVGMGLVVPSPQCWTNYPLAQPTLPNLAYGSRSSWSSASTGLNDPGASKISPVSNPTLNTVAALSWRARYNEQKEQLLLLEEQPQPTIKVGDWVILRSTRLDEKMGNSVAGVLHRRVVSVWHPVVKLSEGRPDSELSDCSRTVTGDRKLPVPTTLDENVEVVMWPCLVKFDDLDTSCQQITILRLLDSMPSISQMRKDLISNHNRPLNHIYDDISPATLGVLRWIVASNRSCIFAIDDANTGPGSANNRIYGMPGYKQFRFAQGAPDKEQRFVKAVNETAQRLKLQHPTIWAWHGSALSNWHSIIREGLHYNTVVNGRTYGNGVYHAMDALTSIGYSGRGSYPSGATWPGSELRIASALSLNEIVNAPNEFTSHKPYLVVQHVDWIQTRYLFVSCAPKDNEKTHKPSPVEREKPTEVLSQDAKMNPRGVGNIPLVLPANAVNATRRRTAGMLKQGLKFRISNWGKDKEEDMYMSDATDADDRELLARPVDKDQRKETPLARQTDFVPGSLDVSKLPRLPQPPYATSHASRALARELKSLQKLQNGNVPAELGWHLCESALDNMYQWIVELHSFDSSLPIHADLKKKGLTSVVLELRFGPSYPFSPPFVRVVRPRFLGFQQGGGGHVTAGGALCMELLTNDGWSAASTIEAVLIQIHMAISSTDPRPARLPDGPVGEYSAQEAIEAFKRACMLHGWTIPPDFRQISTVSAGTSGFGQLF